MVGVFHESVIEDPEAVAVRFVTGGTETAALEMTGWKNAPASATRVMAALTILFFTREMLTQAQNHVNTPPPLSSRHKKEPQAWLRVHL